MSNLPSKQKLANIIARRAGYSRATRIVIGDNNKIIRHVPPGYRKFTTDEYVPNSYRNNFGWKNTYYQSAITEVMVMKRSFSDDE
jgi:hypothetical protein